MLLHLSLQQQTDQHRHHQNQSKSNPSKQTFHTKPRKSNKKKHVVKNKNSNLETKKNTHTPKRRKKKRSQTRVIYSSTLAISTYKLPIELANDQTPTMHILKASEMKKKKEETQRIHGVLYKLDIIQQQIFTK